MRCGSEALILTAPHPRVCFVNLTPAVVKGVGCAGGGPATGPLGGMGGTPLSALPGGWMTGEVTVNCL